MDILIEIKKLANHKVATVTSWKTISGNSYSDYDDLITAVTDYQIGKLDAKLSELQTVEGAEMPYAAKEALLNAVKNTASIVNAIESLTASVFEGTEIVYLPTKKVESDTMSACCKNCRMLICVEPLDLSSIADFSYTFYNCTNLKKVIIPDLSSVTKGAYAFYGCASLNSIPFQDLSLLKDGTAMFARCKNLSEFNISDLPKLSEGSSMFASCSSLKSLQLSLPVLYNGSSMFSGCSSIESLELSDLPNLANGSSMFNGCSRLSNLTLGSLTKLSYAANMFFGCSSLTSIEGLYVPSIASADSMFASCSSVVSISFKDGSLVSALSFFSTFAYCKKIQSVVGLRLSGVCLDLSSGTIKTSENYQRAIQISLPSSLIDCELQGTLYRSGFTLTGCPNLSAASLFSWVAALYDWETNEESKTTIDSDHTLYLTSEQLATLEEYEGDGTKTGAEVIEQVMSYGWNLSE